MNSAKDKATARIRDALDAVELIQTRLSGVTADQLAMDGLLLNACCFRICVVGEAIDMAKSLQPAVFVQTKLRNTTWDGLVAIRNSFIHQYNRASAEAVIAFYKGAKDVEDGLGRLLGAI